MLTGLTAKPDMLKKITWAALNHNEKIKLIDTVRAFHFGCNFLVEVSGVREVWRWEGVRGVSKDRRGYQVKCEGLRKVLRVVAGRKFLVAISAGRVLMCWRGVRL